MQGSRKDISSELRLLSKNDPEESIHFLIGHYTFRARRLYRIALLIRFVLVLCSFLAVLPDSSILGLEHFTVAYGVVITGAGSAGALIYLFARNSRLIETLKVLNEAVEYLDQQMTKMLAADGLTKSMMVIETQRELAARHARLHVNVFDGLEQLSTSWKGKTPEP